MPDRAASFERLLHEAGARLAAVGAPDPQRDARWLLREAAGLSAAALGAALKDPAPEAVAARFEAMLRRRCAREPVSHILGWRDFYSRRFRIDGRALDPRPESESVVEAALEALPSDRPVAVLDLGVGSGCLLLSVLAERPLAQGLGVDVSEAALALAAQNALMLEQSAAPPLRARLELRRGDWLEGVEGAFDAILCNPPYIALDDWARLAPEPRLFEPKAALTPGPDGLAVYRRLAPRVAAHLAPAGAAFFETGFDQADQVALVFTGAGLAAEVIADLGGAPRVVKARRVGNAAG